MRPGFDPWVGKISWRRERPPAPVFCPGEFHGLNCISPRGRKESDMTQETFTSLQLADTFQGYQNLKRSLKGKTQQFFISGYPSSPCIQKTEKVYQVVTT